eukprot:1354305-Pyramimonas_sp.AAC.1
MSPIIAGDFNVSIGAPQEGDDLDLLGRCGRGARAARGQKLIRWLLEHRLQVLSRQPDEQHSSESWTCPALLRRVTRPD